MRLAIVGDCGVGVDLARPILRCLPWLLLDAGYRIGVLRKLKTRELRLNMEFSDVVSSARHR